MGYNVTIINTANEKSEQFCTDDQTLGYQPAPGTTYIINVVPINQAGPGQIASLSEDFPFLSKQAVHYVWYTCSLLLLLLLLLLLFKEL